MHRRLGSFFAVRERKITDHTQRFDGRTDAYEAFRPSYPHALVTWIGARILTVRAPADAPILDVGAGAGAFTRQLATALPDARLLGIEPAAAMRAAAQTHSAHPNVAYVEGAAENMPVEQGAAKAVVAATAAHWFNRPQFYREAARALRPGGVLGIVEYVRDDVGSGAARAVVEFLNRFGEPRAYKRPDYTQELASLADFSDPEAIATPETLRLTLAQYAGLALSSSHARKVVADLGAEKASALVQSIGERFADSDGLVPYGYIFQAFAARRR